VFYIDETGAEESSLRSVSILTCANSVFDRLIGQGNGKCCTYPNGHGGGIRQELATNARQILKNAETLEISFG
jgi:hypothetical protein